MARNLFGGTPADVLEDSSGARVPNAVGTVWDGPSEGAVQYTDMRTLEGAPLSELTADAQGMLPPFRGPENVERVWVDFGAGRVVLVANDVGERFTSHLAASDPHGALAAAQASVLAQKGAANGLATLDAKGRVPVQQLTVCAGGSYVPLSWGDHWRAKRDAAPFTGKARVVCVGDSTTFGYWASDLNATSWPGRIRAALQSQYGDGGSGFFTTSRSATVMGSGKDAYVAAWGANGSIISQTGTWTNGSTFYGPAITHIHTNSASTATFKVRGTTLKIYTLAGTATNAAYTYTIDSGSAVAVAASAAATATIETLTVNGLAEGDHTVTITWNGASSSHRLCLIGVSAENSTGVVVDNLGRSGARTSHFMDTALNTASWHGGSNYPADLVIYSLGINDAQANVAVDTWAANVITHIDAIKAVNQGHTDILLLLPHRGTFGSTNQQYANYSLRARGIAEAYGAALVNIWPMGNNSYDYWNGLGYWGSTTTVGGAGTDPVHPSDAGFEFIANVLTPILTD